MPFQKIREKLTGFGKKRKFSQEATPEQDATIAADELAAGNLSHAVLHIGRALCSDANRRDWLSTLDRVIAQSDDPLQLAPTRDRNYASTVAVRSYILASVGNIEEALRLLGQVLGYSPTAGYLHWVIAWIERPEAARQINLKPLHLFLLSIADDIEQMASDPAARRGTIDLLLPLVQAVQRCQNPDNEFIFVAVGLMRRVGYRSELLPVAEKAYHAHADYCSANTLASAYRAIGDSARAISAYKDALRFDPNDRAARLDIADLHAEAGQFADAPHWYSEVIESFHDDEWALPSYYAVMFMVTKDKVWGEKLIAYAMEKPQNARAETLMKWTASVSFSSSNS